MTNSGGRLVGVEGECSGMYPEESLMFPRVPVEMPVTAIYSYQQNQKPLKIVSCDALDGETGLCFLLSTDFSVW